MSEAPQKRRRVQRSPSPGYKLDDDDNYVPYVPVAQRRQEKLAKITSWTANSDRDRARRQKEEMEEQEDAEKEEERRREKARKERTLLMEAQEVHTKKDLEGACPPGMSTQTEGIADQTCRLQKDRLSESRRSGC